MTGAALLDASSAFAVPLIAALSASSFVARGRRLPVAIEETVALSPASTLALRWTIMAASASIAYVVVAAAAYVMSSMSSPGSRTGLPETTWGLVSVVLAVTLGFSSGFLVRHIMGLVLIPLILLFVVGSGTFSIGPWKNIGWPTARILTHQGVTNSVAAANAILIIALCCLLWIIGSGLRRRSDKRGRTVISGPLPRWPIAGCVLLLLLSLTFPGRSQSAGQTYSMSPQGHQYCVISTSRSLEVCLWDDNAEVAKDIAARLDFTHDVLGSWPRGITPGPREPYVTFSEFGIVRLPDSSLLADARTLDFADNRSSVRYVPEALQGIALAWQDATDACGRRAAVDPGVVKELLFSNPPLDSSDHRYAQRWKSRLGLTCVARTP
ncbi:MAG: hypothetical protein U0Q15_15270 [Kineosporiaceae bacterium]